MPLFQIDGAKLTLTRPTNFSQEKEIQALIEKNLETVFNCRQLSGRWFLVCIAEKPEDVADEDTKTRAI